MFPENELWFIVHTVVPMMNFHISQLLLYFEMFFPENWSGITDLSQQFQDLGEEQIWSDNGLLPNACSAWPLAKKQISIGPGDLFCWKMP